jgi:hypothetical protein
MRLVFLVLKGGSKFVAPRSAEPADDAVLYSLGGQAGLLDAAADPPEDAEEGARDRWMQALSLSQRGLARAADR